MPRFTDRSASDTAARMAVAMQNIRATGRAVDREELANEGFTQSEIDRYAEAARDIANAAAVKMVA